MRKMRKESIMRTSALIFAIILLVVMLSPKASALGIAPARTVMDYDDHDKDEKKASLAFTILNNEHKDMKVMVYIDEEYAKDVRMKPMIVEMRSTEPSKDMAIELNVPKNILKPGMNEIKINVLELPKGFGESNTTKVSATMEVIHQLRINVPYPGKYAESDIYITSQDPDKPISFTIPVFNRGKERIDKAKAMIEIFDVDGRNVANADTNEISLASGGEGKVTAEIYTKLGRGRFKAKVQLTYDGNTLDMEKEFFIGVPLVNINGVTVDSNFRLGGIAKFNLFLENMWNQNLENVYCDISIKDQDNRDVTGFKTASADLAPDSIGKLDAYWDTKDLNPGNYRMAVVLHYVNLVTEKVFDMDVGFDSLSIREYGSTGAVVGGNKSTLAVLSDNSLLISAVIVLIAMNLVLIYYLKKKGGKDKRGNGKDENGDGKDENDYGKSW